MRREEPTNSGIEALDRVLDKGVAVESPLRTARSAIDLRSAHLVARLTPELAPVRPRVVVSVESLEELLELADRVL